MVQFLLDLISLFLTTMLSVCFVFLIFRDIPDKIYEKIGGTGIWVWFSFVASAVTIVFNRLMN